MSVKELLAAAEQMAATGASAMHVVELIRASLVAPKRTVVVIEIRSEGAAGGDDQSSPPADEALDMLQSAVATIGRTVDGIFSIEIKSVDS